MALSDQRRFSRESIARGTSSHTGRQEARVMGRTGYQSRKRKWTMVQTAVPMKEAVVCLLQRNTLPVPVALVL